ncbi:hypothetical protein BI308_23120 [Roseofilum reptotaenium AO1-A]|uniref:Uncharacterized protein n=1 Tax=Roseofilum reptotaenium AO1-A TaxID=1925591 RepID=A0A1L9QKS5_9CYAN|nr:hypothetical protein BI308_23120 [Roseofilum reptotaenium AO1-A]
MKLSTHSTEILREIVIQYFLSLDDDRDINPDFVRAFIASLPPNGAFLKDCRRAANNCINQRSSW